MSCQQFSPPPSQCLRAVNSFLLPLPNASELSTVFSSPFPMPQSCQQFFPPPSQCLRAVNSFFLPLPSASELSTVFSSPIPMSQSCQQFFPPPSQCLRAVNSFLIPPSPFPRAGILLPHNPSELSTLFSPPPPPSQLSTPPPCLLLSCQHFPLPSALFQGISG